MKKILLSLLVSFVGLAAYSQNLNESFEGAFPASDWTFYYAAEAATPPNSSNALSHTTYLSYSGNQSLRFSSYSLGSPYDQYLITPQLNVITNDSIVFWYNDDEENEVFNVGVSSTGTSIADFTFGADVNTTGSGTWTRYVYPVPAGTKYVSIHYKSNYEYYLYIDSVTGPPVFVPTCPKPTSITSYGLASDSVNITWTNGANDSVWIVEYDVNGFTPGTGIVMSSNNDSLTLNGLTQNTDYDVYLRSVCHVGDSSVWVGPYSFTTLCGVAAVPSTETFTSFLPGCWEEATGALSSNSILTYGSSLWTSDGFANIGLSGAAKVELYSNNRDEWLLSPTYDLGVGGTQYQVEFDIALTQWNTTNADTLQADDSLVFLISTDNGATWSNSNIIFTWTDGVEPSTTGEHVVFNLSAYTNSVKFAFYGASSVSGDDVDLFIDNFQVREIPSCADPVGLTTYNVTYDSIALTWTAGVNDSAWIIEYDTAGFTLGTGTIVNASNDSLVLTPINELYTYDIYLKGVCTGGDSSIWLGPITVSTPSSCPKPTAFTSYGVGIDTVALKWTTGPNDSVWLVEYGVDGFTPGTGTTVVSNNDSLVMTGLSAATDYDFYLRGVCTAGDTGVYVGPISRTTDCPVAFTPAYNQDFSSYIPDCWSEAEGTLTDSTTFTSTTTSYWAGDGFGNVGSSGSARIELYSTYADKDWLISPSFDLGNGSTTYQLEFDVALTYWNSTSSDVIRAGDTVALLISEDNGTTWSDTNIMMVWDENSNLSTTGDRVKIRLTGYTDTVKFAFYAEKTVSGGDVNFYVDNFDVIVAPTCPEGDSLMVLNYGFDTATLTWNPGLFDSTWIIEYDTTGFTLGTGNTHLANNDTTAITGLTAVTTYDFYLRSVCTAGDSSTWVGPISVTTKAECPAPTTISDFLLARDSNNITWVGDLADSLYFIEWDSTGFTLGTGNMVTQAEDTIVLNGLGANTTYDFYVRTLCKSNDTSEWVGPFTFTTIESCPVVSSISEFNTTRDSTNITWVSGQYDSVWLIEYDTVGFTLGTGNMVTSTNDTLGINGLNPDTDYQFYVRSICTAGDTSVFVGPVTVTTLESCPSVDSLFAYGTTVNSTNVSWNNGFYDSSWIVEYDVTGFTPGTGNVISSANDTVNITGLTDATMYDVYVRSICTVGDTSELVGPLTFVTSINNPSACGLNFDIPDDACGMAGNEYTISVTSAIGTQLGTDVVLKEVRTIITHTWNSDIEMYLVSPTGDTVELSTNNGGSGDNYGDTTGGCTQYTAFNMEAITNITSGSAPFIGSYIPEGNLNDFNNNSSPIGDWKLLLCDDAGGDFGALQFVELVFDLPVTCPRPDAIQAYNAGKDSVIVSWTAGANDSVWIVEYGPTGYTPGTGTAVGVNNDTTVIYGLSADTEYDFYVRGICHVGDSSIWIGPAVDTTLPACIRTQAFTVLSSDSTSINVGWNIDPSHTSYIVEYGAVGFTPGTGTSSVVNYPNNFLTVSGLTPLTEYEFYVKSVCTSGDTSVWDGPYIGKTSCSSFAALPYLETFSTYVPECWDEATGALSVVPTTFIDTTSSFWREEGFANVGTTGAASLNVYGTSRAEWLISPTVNLGSGAWKTHKIEFDIALTDWNNSNAPANGFGDDDRVALLISTDNGVTWVDSNILVLFDTANTPSHTGDHITYILKNHSGLVKFAFYGESSVSNEDNDIHIDNFKITDTVFVGIDELTALSQFKVYPNPNNGEFTLYNEGNSLKTVVTVMDIQGRVVYDENLTFTQNARKRINLTGVKTGMYILQITSEGRSQQLRLVIE